MYTFSHTFLSEGVGRKDVYLEIKESLESGSTTRIMKGLHEASRSRITLKERAFLFPLVVSLLSNPSLEIKSSVYSFILVSIFMDKTLLLLVVNSVLQELSSYSEENGPSCSLRKSLAIDFISKINDKEFLNHFHEHIEKEYKSESIIVRKSAILSSATFFRAFKEVKKEILINGLKDKNILIKGSSILSILEIEREERGTFREEELEEVFFSLCSKREELEENFENFGMLFLKICRIFRPFPKKEYLEKSIFLLPYLPLYTIREIILSSEGLLTKEISSKLLYSLIPLLGTEKRIFALELFLSILQINRIDIEDITFLLIDSSDKKKEKLLKIQILSQLDTEESIREIRSFLKDKECAYRILSILIEKNRIEKDDLLKGFKYSASGTLKALYMTYPHNEKLHGTIQNGLLSMSNVQEKEAFLFLSGYYLEVIPDEAKRIRRIRNSAGGILYGKKEEREKSEEHLEEYLYFLLNFYTRGILHKEECIKNAQETFIEEPFLLNKFMHLIDLPDRKHLLELIAYKRISYKISSIRE
ncbi:hypothetical protein NEFER03_1704 [Nematocida sp. LUAm3]|nr:hypothetical protein NEFER03_1704 [Nematocida sp. LUAm3]KAI5175694.1 hypothetical protein NEFER02_1581 [Nematocida sp. LUAm2]KAI5178600.1 hypothetical protein NEFER01_1736 [Nematocida sp. LUAm1]